MRPQANQGQQSGEQKKSVFDRLGRQLDPGGRPTNKKSPARYGEHPMHPGMHEPMPPDFGGGGGRYIRSEGPPDIDWRYGRRHQQQHMPPFGRPDRHPSQLGPPPPMPPHYDMDVLGPGRGQPPPYYQHPQMPPQFPPGPPGSMPPMIGGPDPIAMGLHHQRRPSPKYDRHGNPIRGPMGMDHPPGVSPPRNFMGPPMPGPMMPPAGYDMPPMRPGMYPQERWDDNMDLGMQMGPRLLPNDRFMDPASNQRFQAQQRQHKGPQMLINPELLTGPQSSFEAPRYSKWRERRDVITNLDRQTAQSSSKTDSLKSSLQQPDNRGNMSKKPKDQKAADQSASKKSAGISKKDEATASQPEAKKKKEPAKPKEGPQDISDGEIVDDEDSSDDSDAQKAETPSRNQAEIDNQLIQSRLKPGYSRKPLDGQFHDTTGKRRRVHDRDEYSMDYETISDEELDDFMSDKKSIGDEREGEDKEGKNLSEIELLNALGIDWANLIEMSKQSRKEAPTSDSALRRFSIPNFLPTLGISPELAGPEIYDLIVKITS